MDVKDFDEKIVKNVIKSSIKMEEKVRLDSIKEDELVKTVKCIFNEPNYELYITKMWIHIGFKKNNAIQLVT